MFTIYRVATSPTRVCRCYTFCFCVTSVITSADLRCFSHCNNESVLSQRRSDTPLGQRLRFKGAGHLYTFPTRLQSTQ